MAAFRVFDRTGIVRLRRQRFFLGGWLEDLAVEVNGVAGEVGFGPAPVAPFDDETVMSGAMDSEIFLRTKLSTTPGESSC